SRSRRWVVRVSGFLASQRRIARRAQRDSAAQARVPANALHLSACRRRVRLERDERPSRRDADELSAHRGWIRRARDSLTHLTRRLSVLLHAAARHGVLPRLWQRGERPPGCNATVRLRTDPQGVGLLLLEVLVLVSDVVLRRNDNCNCSTRG